MGSSFAELLAAKQEEDKKKERAIVAKREAEEARLQREREAKNKKEKEDAEEAKRLRLLARKRELAAAENARLTAEDRAKHARRLEEDMKRQRREKALGINGTMKDNTAMGKIRAQQSHPSLGRQKESPAASSSSRGGGSGTSNVSAYAPTPSNAMSRAERRALADAREFGTAPPKSTPFAPNRKKTVEEESFSKLSRISARMAGRDSPSSSRPIDRSRGRERDGLNDIAYARHREPPSINVSSLINRMGMDGSKRPDKGRTGASSSSSSSRDKVTSQSSKNGNGQKRRRRSPSDSEELDSDHLDDDDDIRPSKRPVPKRRSSDRDDRPPAKGKGGGILATLGFDPYASFSRSGKGRDAYTNHGVNSDEDSDLDMEANAETIRKEEARAARLAREADRAEEEAERKRREEKLKRKNGR